MVHFTHAINLIIVHFTHSIYLTWPINYCTILHAHLTIAHLNPRCAFYAINFRYIYKAERFTRPIKKPFLHVLLLRAQFYTYKAVLPTHSITHTPFYTLYFYALNFRHIKRYILHTQLQNHILHVVHFTHTQLQNLILHVVYFTHSITKPHFTHSILDI